MIERIESPFIYYPQRIQSQSSTVILFRKFWAQSGEYDYKSLIVNALKRIRNILRFLLRGRDKGG